MFYLFTKPEFCDIQFYKNKKAAISHIWNLLLISFLLIGIFSSLWDFLLFSKASVLHNLLCKVTSARCGNWFIPSNENRWWGCCYSVHSFALMLNNNVITSVSQGSEFKEMCIQSCAQASHTFLFPFYHQCSVLSAVRNVIMRLMWKAVDKMRCLRKRSMFPFLGFLITFLLFFNLYMDDGYVLVGLLPLWGLSACPWMVLSSWPHILLLLSLCLCLSFLGGREKTAGRDTYPSCELWKIRPHIQRSIQFLRDH